MRHVLLALGLLVLAATNPSAAAVPQQSPPFRPFVASGDLIYLSGTLATDTSGAVVGDDIRAQTTKVLDTLAARLTEAGSSVSQVAAVTVYLTNAADFPAMNEVYGKYWPTDPPTRTTVVTNLVVPKALVEISMVALKRGAERKMIHPGTWMRSPSPYSYGIQSGQTLFLSGLIARNGKDNSFSDGDITAQMRVVLQNAREILEAAGMTFADVVSSRVYITDTANFQAMNEVYRTAFPAAPPARATVRCALTSPQYLVEITMLAVKDSARKAITTPNADGTPGRPNPVLSSAVQVGNRLFLSGALGNTPTNRGDITGQTRETLSRLGRTLTAAGFEWKDVVDAVVYLTDVKQFAGMNDVWRQLVPTPFPARATVEAGLVAPDGLIEVMVTAVRK
jgi:2-iminobutanoate/2-iminopropanoate deaminase